MKLNVFSLLKPRRSFLTSMLTLPLATEPKSIVYVAKRLTFTRLNGCFVRQDSLSETGLQKVNLSFCFRLCLHLRCCVAREITQA